MRIIVAKIYNALGYSLQGLKIAFADELAFRIEVWLVIFLVVLAFLLPVTGMERTLMILSLLLVLCVELLNTGIEAAINRISLEPHPMSKKAKDCGSAAVFMSLVMVGIAWISPWL